MQAGGERAGHIFEILQTENRIATAMDRKNATHPLWTRQPRRQRRCRPLGPAGRETSLLAESERTRCTVDARGSGSSGRGRGVVSGAVRMRPSTPTWSNGSGGGLRIIQGRLPVAVYRGEGSKKQGPVLSIHSSLPRTLLSSPRLLLRGLYLPGGM